MYNLYQADFRHNFFILKTPKNMFPSWWKNGTLTHFSKPNFDMPWPNCCKSYKVNDDPPFFHPFLVKKNICRYLLFCTIALAFIIREL
jgi:hypothetical protein